MKKILVLLFIIAFSILPSFSQIFKKSNLYLKLVDDNLPYHYVTKNGEILIRAQDGNEVKGKFAIFDIKGKWGAVNKNGDFIIPQEYDYISQEYEKRIAFIKDGQVGYFNEKGEIIIPARTARKYILENQDFDYFNFSEGLAGCYDYKTDKYGFINKKGKWVIKPQYKNVKPFSQGLALVKTINNKYGYITKHGNWKISPKFDYADSFNEKLARVAISPKYQTTQSYSPTKMGYINKRGKFKIKPQYINTSNFSENLAAVQTEDLKWGYIDKNNNFVIDPKFYAFDDGTIPNAIAMPFKNGYSAVSLDKNGNGFAFINADGIIVKTYSNLYPTKFKGFYYVQIDGRQYIVDYKGKIIE